ncbi:MAG: alpha/beta hydrolase [Leptolyngbyaceae cyanobacterium CSU_1_4]|nr:alpha/beta hydrolase [Leptolyngbyaceae cyanobacterium CSU_1_4]
MQHPTSTAIHDSSTDRSVLGGVVRTYQWNWKNKDVTVVYEVLGEGSPLLLLPAFSSVSSREEMRGVAQLLAPYFQVVVPDWIGFGESSRLPFQYDSKIYHKFLNNFVSRVFSEPVVVIAAGHTAGYVMQMASRDPAPWSWVVLVAPTWRRSVTDHGRSPKLYSFIRAIVRTPILGQFLYFLNTTRLFLGWMYRRHVYGDRRNVTRDLIRQKWKSTQKRGARFASVAFVTGGLDPVRKRAEFFDYFQPLPVPTLMVIGEETPPKSREEMEVVAHFSQVQSFRMPGALGLHEEYPEHLVAGILPFLKKYLSLSNPL